mgnify:CR=1 FL=1
MRRTVLAFLMLCGCDGIRATLVDVWPNAWDESVATAQAAAPDAPAMQPTFDGNDVGRAQSPVVLQTVLTGLERPTDIQFPPGRSDVAVVLQKDGEATVFSVPSTGSGETLTTLLKLKPLTNSEQGMLGWAFHPSFSTTGGRAFLHHSVKTDAGKASRISELQVTIADGKWSAGKLSTVLDTLLYLRHETRVWLEVTTLLIPGENDSNEELDALSRWLVDNIGPDVPLHFSAFHPDFHMRDKPCTPPQTLYRARRIALANGLHHVYTGNVHDVDGDTTYCPSCGDALIVRDWYRLDRWKLRDGHCTCGAKLAGVFEGRPGTWGRKRLPLAM